MLAVTYFCIINHPKCSDLKENLFIISCCLVGLLGGILLLGSSGFTYASCFWLVDWAGLEGLNGLTLLALALVLNLSADWQAGRQALSPCGESFFSSLTCLSYVDVQQKLKLQWLFLRIRFKLYSAPSTTCYC